jgi:hypothetical protein
MHYQEQTIVIVTALTGYCCYRNLINSSTTTLQKNVLKCDFHNRIYYRYNGIQPDLLALLNLFVVFKCQLFR